MTKKLFVSVLIIITVISVNAQQKVDIQKNNLKLSVDLTSIAHPLDKIYLTYYNTSTKVRFIDSIDVSQSRIANFTTYLPEPILGTLRIARDAYNIFLEEGAITVTAKDSLSKSTVKGSAAHIEDLNLKNRLAVYDEPSKILYTKYSEASRKNDRVAADKIVESIDSLEKVINESVYLPFIKSGKNSPVVLFALTQYAGYAIDPQKIEPLYNQLNVKVKELPGAIRFKEKIILAKKTEIGQYALPFIQKDTAGVDVSLASFKGKYVLLDFWASWCGPCRVENPNVVNAFNKYKNNGFTVLSVSLDQPGARDRWIKAIHDDQLTWTHVSDLKFWDNDVAKQYGIQAIPQNYLIDTEGKIIGKNLRGEALQAKLNELFKTK